MYKKLNVVISGVNGHQALLNGKQNNARPRFTSPTPIVNRSAEPPSLGILPQNRKISRA